MTVGSEVSRVAYVGSGTTGPFPVPFYFLENDHIRVIRTTVAGGAEYEMVETTDYVLTGAGVPAGGSLTLVSALSAAYTLSIFRDPDLLQNVDYTENDAFPAETHETALDKLTMIVQRVKDLVTRSFHLSDGAVSVSTELPPPQANSGLGWNATGTAIINYAFAIGGSLVDLAASTGSALVGFLQAGAGAIARTVQDKLREAHPSVDDFGATGDGVTNDTTAFTAAQAAHLYVRVPAGKTYIVSAGLNYWQFFGEGTVLEPGIAWDLSPTPQDDFSVLKRYKAYTWGTFEHAVAASFSAGAAINTCLRGAPDHTTQAQESTQVLGVSASDIRASNERPSVALNLMIANKPQNQMVNTTFTANSVTDSTAVTGVAALAAAGKLKRGMIIDVDQAADRLSSTHSGTVQSWSGHTITVDAWWDGVGSASTPGAGAVATVNPVNKLWGQNTNIFVQETNVAGSGYEMGIIADSDAKASKVWGFDVVSLSGTKILAPYVQRGGALYGYLSMNYPALGTTNISFCAEAPVAHGFHVRNPASTAYAFSVLTGASADATGLLTVGGALKWAVQQDGLVGNDYRMMHQDTDVLGVTAGGVLTDIANVIVNTTAGKALKLPTAVGKSGRVYTILAYAGCTVAPQGGETLDASTAAFTVAPRGKIQCQSDGANWLILSISGYGKWVRPSFSAGDFTASGAMTWTVGAGDVTEYAYTLVGKTMTVSFAIGTTTVAGVVDTTLFIKIPDGKTAAAASGTPVSIYNNGVPVIGMAYTNNALFGANIAIQFLGLTNYVAEVNLTTVVGQITFEIS